MFNYQTYFKEMAESCPNAIGLLPAIDFCQEFFDPAKKDPDPFALVTTYLGFPVQESFVRRIDRTGVSIVVRADWIYLSNSPLKSLEPSFVIEAFEEHKVYAGLAITLDKSNDSLGIASFHHGKGLPSLGDNRVTRIYNLTLNLYPYRGRYILTEKD